jgi:hypothetical protein
MLLPLALLLACPPEQGLSTVKDDPDGRTDTDSGDDPDVDTGPVMNAEGEYCDGDDDDGDGRVDEGWPDADGNGRTDCLDATCPALAIGEGQAMALAEACATEGLEGYPLADAWTARAQWSLDSVPGMSTPLWSFSMPAVGDLDGDEAPEVVVVVTTDDLLDSRVVALDGATGAIRWTWSGALATGGVIVADVNADGAADVVAYDTSAQPVALGGDGRLLWRGNRAPSAPDYPLLSVADLDNDGTPEVIADDLVVSGRTGARRFSLDVPDTPDPYRMAAVGDVDGDGDQELALDGRLFDSDGTELWDSGLRGSYGMWAVLLDADDDGDAEIGFVGDEWTLLDERGRVLYSQPYGVAQPGPPCAGDFDGDGEAEVAWPAYDALVMYELDGTPVWSRWITDASGLAGCSGFDMDGDGALEVLFADEVAFRVLDGRTGATRISEESHRSGTVFEYPVPADIDGDGHAELLTTRNDFRGSGSAVVAWEHAGTGWTPGGATWAVHDFAITNVMPDGRVPARPIPSWQAYNVYRARVAVDALGPPDLVAAITDACVADCAYGPVKLAVQVGNQGGEAVPAGTWLSLYARATDGSRRWLGRWAMPAIPAQESLDGVEFPLRLDQVGSAGWEVVIDDDGTGVGQVEECDETNNAGTWADAFCP